MGGSLAGYREQCCAHVAQAMELLGVPFAHCCRQLCLAWKEFLHFSERKRKAAKKIGDEGLSLSHFARASIYHIQAPGSDHSGQNGSGAEEQGQEQILPLGLIAMEGP